MSENVNVATEVGVKTKLEDTERAKIREPRTKRGNRWSYIPLVLRGVQLHLATAVHDLVELQATRESAERHDELACLRSCRRHIVRQLRRCIRADTSREVLPQLHHRHRGYRGPGLDRQLDGRLRTLKDALSGRSVLLVAIVATLIVPFETFAIPMVYLVSNLPRVALYDDGFSIEQGWNNSYEVMIIPFIANAFSIFLFTQYYKSIPRGTG